MKRQNDDPKQYENSRVSKDALAFQPIETTLRNYPSSIRENYPKLKRKDFHLAEIFRIGATGSIVSASTRKLSPVQTKIDSRGRIWVDVIMEKKKDVKISELRKIMQIHGKLRNSRFISGRVEVNNLQLLIDKAIRLQAARPVAPALNNSVKEIKANRARLNNEGFGNIDGTGVIVGVIDVGGCAFGHSNFLKENGNTRLLYLWDQNGKIGTGKKKPKNYKYGVEYNQAQINTVLAQRRDDQNLDPYEKIGYHPRPNAHGTHVLDIAAGGSNDQNFRGVAPGADLIYVDLGSPTTLKKIAKEEMETLGSSKYLFDAVKYIFEKADEENKPAVINISLGSNGGPHDGTSLMETFFDDLLKETGRAIVIAAGNNFQNKVHTAGKVTLQKNAGIFWVVPRSTKPNQDSRLELEIWYPRDIKVTAEILSSTEVSLAKCPFGTILASNESETSPTWLISNERADSDIAKSKNTIHILLDNNNVDFVGDEWQVILSMEDSQTDNNVEADFDAWIDRNENGTPTEFANNFVEKSTINGLGNAELPLVVGAIYINTQENPPEILPSYESSSGPSLNPDFSGKPELSAPGENISSAQALTFEPNPQDPSAPRIESGRSDASGTSFAAPHVTGVIALMFQQGLSLLEPRTLGMKEIREILIKTSDKNPPFISENEHDNRMGFGRLNAVNALKKIGN